MNPCTFFKCLADDVRLKLLLLIARVEEACVCDLMTALNIDQPKTSRNLAKLRQCGILLDERRGKWMFYRLNPELPDWVYDVIQQTAQKNPIYLDESLSKLTECQTQSAKCC